MYNTQLVLLKWRGKRWAPKTRSGCTTCRKRRVKCDETRPICHACARLYHECIYRATSYQEIWGIDTHRENESAAICCALLTTRPRVSLYTSEETYHLSIYDQAVAPWLSTYSQPIFFDKVLPVWAAQHKAVKHALVALTMAGEQQYLSLCTKQHRRKWHYSETLKHMYSPTISRDVMMLASVILWIHDNIMGDNPPATTHMKGFIHVMLAYQKARAPVEIGKDLDCTIWRGFLHWAQRAQCCPDTNLTAAAVAVVRKKFKFAALDRLNQAVCMANGDALLFVQSVVWACDQGDDKNISLLTFGEVRSFLHSWYTSMLVETESSIDDRTILTCHYLIMDLLIRAQERETRQLSPDLVDDVEGLDIFESMLTSLESISIESLTQRPGKKDLILPIIPVALEAERLAPKLSHRARIRDFLAQARRVESFWSTNFVSSAISMSETRADTCHRTPTI